MILQGDCLIKLKELADNSIDSIVTDPPYHLVSIVKRFGKENSAPAREGKDGSFKRLSGGFMGKTWDGLGEDGIGIANNPVMWKECLRVLKPGGYLLSFGGTRTYHRMASAIEDAGFEVRDMIEWVYGSGFPKSHNIGKNIEKIKVGGIKNLKQIGTKKGIKVETGTQGFSYSKEYVAGKSMGGKQISGDIPVYEINNEYEGWGTALKPSHEPICMARKPLVEKTVAENCLKYGTGGINIDESRVGFDKDNENFGKEIRDYGDKAGGQWQKGKQERSVPPELGRFPANLIHDNSEEVRECFPETSPSRPHKNKPSGSSTGTFGMGNDEAFSNFNDSGNASRFFKSIIYTAKASKSERNKGCEDLESSEKFTAGNYSQSPTCKDCEKTLNGTNDHSKCSGEVYYKEMESKNTKNNHPTVKPIALMEYLIKMVTPPIVFVCEKCYNIGYEKQKTNSDSTQLSNMRDTIQAERQPAQGEILQQEVCLSGGENDNRETLSVLQENVSTEKNGQKSSDLLQSAVFRNTYRDNKKKQQVNKNQEGLFSDLQTREQNGKQAGDGFTTPINNGGTLGEESTSDRDSSSQEPQERRQPNRELGNNDTETTQPNSKIKEENNLSTLSGNRRCPKCGESMVKRAGIVLDPFAGSGSTLVAAKKNGYKYIGIEMTAEYIPIIEARLKAIKEELKLI